MKAKLITAFYAFGLLHHLYIYYFTRHAADFSKTTKQAVLDVQLFGNRYLTSWNMGLQVIYFLMAFIFEVLLLNKNKISPNVMEKLSKVRGYMFTTLILPSAIVVAFFFWLFYHLNRDLVMPIGIEEVFPDWVNHSIHTNIIILPIIELTLQNMYIPSFRMSLIGLTLYSQIYNIMFLLSYVETGKWMYLLYEQLSWPQRIALMETKFALGVIVCIVGRFIQKKSKKCDITKADFKTRFLNVTKKLL